MEHHRNRRGSHQRRQGRASLALTGFGLDSGIEAVSAVLVLHRLQAAGHGEANEARERRALRAIGITFFALATYLTADGVHSLLTTSQPDIAINAAALVVMPVLAWSKRTTGRRIDGPLGTPRTCRCRRDVALRAARRRHPRRLARLHLRRPTPGSKRTT
ncbi:MAG: hypothetical protein M0008_03280 [Actinomycetota bacterium]|nr:hypothetical protein [Actinomycetota bacterium]